MTILSQLVIMLKKLSQLSKAICLKALANQKNGKYVKTLTSNPDINSNTLSITLGSPNLSGCSNLRKMTRAEINKMETRERTGCSFFTEKNAGIIIPINIPKIEPVKMKRKKAKMQLIISKKPYAK